MNKNDLVGQSAEHVVRHIVVREKLSWFYLREYNPMEDRGDMDHDFSCFETLRRDDRAFQHGASLVESSDTVATGFCSYVKKSSFLADLGLMDFQVPYEESKIGAVVDVMRTCGATDGVILDSGNSFHGYGFNLMSQAAWQRFMHLALLSPLTDTRYIAHRLLEGVGVLRISATASKPKVPTVVAVF